MHPPEAPADGTLLGIECEGVTRMRVALLPRDMESPVRIEPAVFDTLIRRRDAVTLIEIGEDFGAAAACSNMASVRFETVPETRTIDCRARIELHRGEERIDTYYVSRFGDVVRGKTPETAWEPGDNPRWLASVIRAGIEWLHILSQQPAKLGRYAVGNPKFLARMWRQTRRDRQG